MVYTRRKKELRYKWEAITPLPNFPPHCPVTAFANYWNTLTQAKMWGKSSPKNQLGIPASVFRTASTTMRECSTQTIATDARSVMHECGVDTSHFSPGSLRGAVNTYLITQGVPESAIMDRGNWHSQIIFQKHYSRAASQMDWSKIVFHQQKANIDLPEEFANKNAVEQLAEVLKELNDTSGENKLGQIMQNASLSVLTDESKSLQHTSSWRRSSKERREEGVSTDRRNPPPPTFSTNWRSDFVFSDTTLILGDMDQTADVEDAFASHSSCEDRPVPKKKKPKAKPPSKPPSQSSSSTVMGPAVVPTPRITIKVPTLESSSSDQDEFLTNIAKTLLKKKRKRCKQPASTTQIKQEESNPLLVAPVPLSPTKIWTRSTRRRKKRDAEKAPILPSDGNPKAKKHPKPHPITASKGY